MSEVKGPVLISGGTGLLGANTAWTFAKRGFNVICYDASPREIDFLKEPDIAHNIKVVRGDILDFPRIIETIRKYDIEGIIHTAAVIVESTARELPVMTTKVNVEGTLNLLEAARMMNLKRFIYISTGGVYGYRPDLSPISEDEPITWRGTVYHPTKYMGEVIVEVYNAVYGLDTVILRTYALYGPGQMTLPQVLNILEKALMGERVEMPKGGDNVWDLTYVKDIAQGIYLAYTAPRPLKHRIFNCSLGRNVKLSEVADAIMKAVPGSIINIGPGLDEQAYAQSPIKGPLNITRAKEELGYEPKYDIWEGVKDFVEWLRKQPKYQRAC